MSDPLPGDKLPTLHGAAADQTPPPDISGSFTELPTLGGAVVSPSTEVPVIAGYEIREELGRGGMGVVYLAQQLRPCRLVALKVLRASAATATDRARFEREANALAKLSCPGVVQVYDAGSYTDRDGCSRPYVALELVRGTSLDVVLRAGVLAPRQAAALLLPLARTMQTVHASGIVHRDLKPANVLLSEASRERERPEGATPVAHAPGSPKITDFGLAHLLASEDTVLTRAGQVLGTPSYAAPEQVESGLGAIGPACDVHALGAILYECLTGRPPFKGASLVETIDQVARLEPVAVRRLRPDVPHDLQTICHKCLRKAPHERYRSADDLADDLERFLAGRSISARPVSVVEHAWRGARRRPLTSALAAMVALLVLGGIVLAAWLPARLQGLKRASDAAAADAEKNRALAISQEYHALMQEASRLPDGEPDWPSRQLETIRRAAALDTPLRDPVALRSHAARCLAAPEFVALPAVPLGFTASRLAPHPSQDLVAVAQFKAWPYLRCQVLLLEVPTGKVVRKLHFFPSKVRWKEDGTMAQDGIAALAFSPDCRHLVAGTLTGMLVRWDLDHTEPAAIAWEAHQGEVRHLCLDEDALFSIGADGQFIRWSISGDWRPTHLKEAHGQPVLAAGELLLSDGDRVRYLNPKNLSARRPAVAAEGSLISVPPAPAPAALAQGPSLWRFDPTTGRKGTDFRRKGLSAHERAISDLATSPDGELIASACDCEGRVRVWDAASGRLLAELPRGGDPCRVAFDAMGRWLMVLDSTEVRFFEVRRSAVQTRTALTSRTVLAACWVGRDRLACVGGDRDSGEGEVSIWPIEERAPLVRRAIRLPESRLPVRMAASLASGRLAWTDAAGVSLSRPDDLSERARVTAKDVQALDDDGERLWLAGERKARAWLGEEARPGPVFDNYLAERVRGVADLWSIAAGKRVVVAGGKGGIVRVLDVEGAKLLQAKRLSSAPICCVALDADESMALVGVGDGSLALVYLDDMTVRDVTSRHRDRVTAARFLPGGRAMTASLDGDVRLWQVRDGAMSLTLTLSLGVPVVGVSASDDGQRLAIVLAGERAVRVWHLDRLWDRLGQMRLQ